MKPGLQVGQSHRMRFRVPASKTVPALYPEAREFRHMPAVFATGFLVGLIEWGCMQLLQPYLDDDELTLGTHIDVSHCAPTPAGLEIEVEARLIELRGRCLRFEVSAHDGIELVSRGTHERHVAMRERFDRKVGSKLGPR